MSNNICHTCQRNFTARSRRATCSVCSIHVHASCDPLLTDGVLKAMTVDPLSRIRYICNDCLPYLETLRRMHRADDDSSTCAMDNSVLSFRSVPSTKLEDEPVDLINAPISDSKHEHESVTKRLDVIEEKLELISQGLISRLHQAQPTSQSPKLPISYSDAVVKGTSRVSTKNETKNLKASLMESFTLICTNIPESESPSLRERQEADRKSWSELCSVLELDVHPVQLTRLSRPPTSPHAGEPRLLRVLMKNESDVETVLLSAFKLRLAKSIIRIYPDIPWKERKILKDGAKFVTMDVDLRSVFVHGVPELKDADELKNKQHDCTEWKYIKELLGVDNIITTKIFRLPHSTNYKGNGPRILKVTLSSDQIVTSLLSSWYQHRNIAPPDLRKRGYLPRKTEKDKSDNVALIDSAINTSSSKPLDVVTINVPRPVQ